MADSYVLLWLEAPLQSWGYESRFNRRETLGFPTRSGVLGLILCAMGAGDPQTEWLGKMSKYGQTVLAFSKKESSRKFRDNLKLVDFQMVGSAYDDSDPWQTLLIPKTIEGKKAVSGGTKLTYRYYLQNAKFAVIVCVPEELKETIKSALQRPHWDLYLGRKCCVPTDLVYRGCFTSEEEAKQEALRIADSKDLECQFEVLEGQFPEEGEVMTVSDVPVQFGTFKKYVDRQVTVIDV